MPLEMNIVPVLSFSLKQSLCLFSKVTFGILFSLYRGCRVTTKNHWSLQETISRAMFLLGISVTTGSWGSGLDYSVVEGSPGG